MIYKLSIFPFKTKWLGLAMVLLASPFAYLYFWGGRPEMFNVRIFAIVTNYLETRYFVFAQTNILDELAAILFIAGIALISFSKEKDEKGYFENLRLQALVKALFFTLIVWILAFLFVYGMTIIVISFFIFILFLVMYNLFFRLLLLRKNDSAT